MVSLPFLSWIAPHVPPGKHLTPPWMVPLPLLTVEEPAVRILLDWNAFLLKLRLQAGTWISKSRTSLMAH